MPAVKSPGAVAEKWGRVTPQRAPDYEAGVRAPRTPWAAATQASQERYKAGVLDAANKGRFAQGVAKAGDARWSERSATVGPGRYAEGVATSAGRYEQGVAPYIDTIQRTTLPQRYPKGDPRNLQRVSAITAALRARKTGGQ